MRIALVGMTGVGKTTIARALGARLNMPVYDLDEAMVHKFGQPIPVVFQERGECEFRKLEYEALRQYTSPESRHACILATGGGVVVSPACRDELRRAWTTVWLKASVETLKARLQPVFSERPILHGESTLEQRLQGLWDDRYRYYEQVAKLTVHVDGRSVPEVVEWIMEHVKP